MDMENRIKQITVLAAFFQAELGPAHIKLYIGALEDLTDEQMGHACRAAVKKLKWMPKPAELIDLARGGALQLEDRATVQAGIVLALVRTAGYYHPPKFDDLITAALFRSRFSWAEVCDLKAGKDTDFWSDRFREAYRSLERDAADRDRPLAQLEDLDRRIAGLLEGIGGMNDRLSER